MTALFKLVQYLAIGTVIGVVGGVCVLYATLAIASMFGASDGTAKLVAEVTGGLVLLWGVSLAFRWFGEWSSERREEKAAIAALHR